MRMHFLSGSALSKIVVVLVMLLGALPALASAETYMAVPQVGTRQTAITTCPPGTIQYRDGGGGPMRCVAKPSCASGQLRDVQGDCHCPPGTTEVQNGNGQPAQCLSKPSCAPGHSRDARGVCRCPPGTIEVRSAIALPAQCVAKP